MSGTRRVRLLYTAFATIAVVVAVWLYIDRFIAPPEYIFPRLSSVVRVFMDPNKQLLYHTFMTASASTTGLLIAIVGSAIAVACTVFVPMIRPGVYGLGLSLKATPVVAMAPLLIIWLGTGLESKIAAAAMPCFFPILVAALDSIQRTPAKWVDVAKVFGATNWEIFRRIRFPAAIPWILSGIRVAAPLSIVGAIVGELVGARAGLGYLIISASYQLQTDVVFAAILAGAALAGVLVGLVSAFEAALNISRNVVE